MSTSSESLAWLVREVLGKSLTVAKIAADEVTVEIVPEDLLTVAIHLRDDPRLNFGMLVDVCGVDYLQFGRDEWETEAVTATGFGRAVERADAQTKAPTSPRRFAVVYHLLSISKNQRLRLRTWPSGDPPRLASVVEIWPSADWFEREAFDLFGILFDGHPDLRRILTDYGFIGHPFRKDFPLIGNVEMLYDPAKGRVVYQPVSIEPRVLVPRVIRETLRDGGAEEADEHA